MVLRQQLQERRWKSWKKIHRKTVDRGTARRGKECRRRYTYPDEAGTETGTTESPISTVAVANADEAQDEIETVKAQLVAAQKKVAALEAEIAAGKEKTEKAIARAEEAEKSAENNKAPETTDQAYERYMKNADLLCKQLSDLEGRQNAILDEAREQAEREREKARQDAADIIGEARKTAERLLKDAQENKENAIGEAKKIHEDSLRAVEVKRRNSAMNYQHRKLLWLIP